MTPMETAIWWIEYIHRHGKDALKNPSEDMPWWQKSNLDLYAFFLGVAITVLYILVKVIKLLLYIVLKMFGKSSDKVKKH